MQSTAYNTYMPAHRRNFVCDDGDLSPPLLKVVVNVTSHHHFFKVEFAEESHSSCYQKRSVA